MKTAKFIQDIGIEHADDSTRHGQSLGVFTLWFAANLTVADFALGGLLNGMPTLYAALAIFIGNILGGTLLGLMASMGPTFGYPQIIISKVMFGKLGNAPFAVMNWISTVGWFTVNIILGGIALKLLGINFILGSALLVITQIILVLYGHDLIHIFEKIMAFVLSAMFIIVAIIAYKHINLTSNISTHNTFNAFDFAWMVATMFSYLMSWSPYASDYSRYLPRSTSKFKIFLFAFLGGAIASIWLEFIGFMVSLASGKTQSDPLMMLANITGKYSILALLAIVFGIIAANTLNLYTNSLSALTIYKNFNRKIVTIAAGIFGYVLALIGSNHFATFYSDFLVILDYWITPWIGIMLAMFFIRKIRSGVESAPNFIAGTIVSYILAFLISIPFMNLTIYGIPFEGFIAKFMNGADVSYFVSFLLAFLFTILLTSSQRPKYLPA